MNQEQDYLIHYGVLGMKWGVRKDRRNGLSKQDYKGRKKIDKALKKESKRAYRTHDPRIKNRMKVNRRFNEALSKDEKLGKTWEEAFQAHRIGDHENYVKKSSAYNRRLNEIKSSFDNDYTEAWIKDHSNIKVSDINKKYLNDVLTKGATPDYLKKKK